MANLLLDSCVGAQVREPLASAGYAVEWVADWPEDPGDASILSHAESYRQIVVTLDKDFGELAVVKGQSHCGIIRLRGLRLRSMGPVLLDVLQRHGDLLRRGALVTVTPERIRIRPAEPSET